LKLADDGCSWPAATCWVLNLRPAGSRAGLRKGARLGRCLVEKNERRSLHRLDVLSQKVQHVADGNDSAHFAVLVDDGQVAVAADVHFVQGVAD